MKSFFYLLFVFLTMFYRQIVYSVNKRKLVVNHVYVDAPIGIIGQPNKINWDVQNFLYAKVKIGSKKRFVTQNEFHFINSSNTQNFIITFYGLKEKVVKTFDLHFIEAQKAPSPKLFLKKEHSLELRPEFNTKNVIPFFRLSFSLRPSILKITTHIQRITDLKFVIHQPNISELTEEMLETDKEQDINTLTKTIKNEKRLLPQSDPRPYYEAIMESRWFG